MSIEQAKRTIAAGSAEGLRHLGAGVYKPCFQGATTSRLRRRSRTPRRGSPPRSGG